MRNIRFIIGAGSGIGARTARAVLQPGDRGVLALAEGLRQEGKPYNIRTTVISPGAVATELLNSITEPDIAEAVRKRVYEIALPADSFARAVAFAISQPEEMDVNEILFRPTQQEL